ncbi:MAG TPA: DUF2330 domain-containing protein [Labilithrix sp.]|nr:DUF2330 domain-containing protein [Labilithrix sp.]
MSFLRNALRSSGPAAALLFCAVTDTRDADACGGCFHGAKDVGGSIVTDHRMVFEITTKETILWDQVRYAGNPEEFAWVLPVRAGATIELSRGEWIAALDAATRSTVQGPQIVCPPKPRPTSTGSTSSSSSGSSSSSSSRGGGCGGDSSPTTYNAVPETAGSAGAGNTDDSNVPTSTPTYTGNEDVEVVAQASIGPYQAVTIRAAGTTGISDWLTTNGFVIPPAIAPVIDSYVQQKLDFIALRLRPGVGVQAMRPVRIVSPGADPTLPLRMVAAGVGAKVGITLWVIGEGRYRTQNFPEAPVDWPALSWDNVAGRSNRMELEAAALATNAGRSWIAEAATRTSLTRSTVTGAGLPNVFDAYRAQCAFKPPRTVPCDESALPPADGQPVEADGGIEDGGADGGGSCTKTVTGCDGFDDLEVASRSIHVDDVWITRLRADLPVSALATDLVLEASPEQVALSPAHSTRIFNPPFDPCLTTDSTSKTTPPPRTPARTYTGNADGCTCRTTPLKSDFGTWLVIGLTMVALPLVVRRKRR